MTQNSGRLTRNNRVRGNVFGDYTAGTMKKTTKKKKRTVEERAASHVRLIDKVFGGKLYPFRSYRARPETPGEMSDARLSPAVPPPVAPPD